VKRIGLTGSIGAGKSAASDWLRGQDFAVHDADAAVHEIYARPEVQAWLHEHFPGAVDAGKVNRHYLAETIYTQPRMRKFLEDYIHPLVAAHRAEFLYKARQAGRGFAVLDIPLLFETGREAEMDEVWLVTAPVEVRRVRALARPGMTAEKFDRINGAQMSEDQKILRANHVIENSGTLAQLHEKLAWLTGRI